MPGVRGFVALSERGFSRPSGEPGVSGDFWGSQEGCQGPGGGHGNPLQYSRLENPMDRGAWWATVRGVEDVIMHIRLCCLLELSS